jgi:hypothetical protein
MHLLKMSVCHFCMSAFALLLCLSVCFPDFVMTRSKAACQSFLCAKIRHDLSRFTKHAKIIVLFVFESKSYNWFGKNKNIKSLFNVKNNVSKHLEFLIRFFFVSLKNISQKHNITNNNILHLVFEFLQIAFLNCSYIYTMHF